jgi:hypothetical protein
VESNFDPNFASKKFLDLKEEYNFVPFQIRCFADGKIVLDRFTKRANSGERHPGHVDDNLVKEFEPLLLKGKIEPLNIGGEFFDIDTSDFDKIDYDKLFSAIKSATGID